VPNTTILALKIKNLKAAGDFDIIRYKWIVDCVVKGMFIPLEPRYMIFAKEDTKEMFVNEIDMYNDSYRSDATVDTLREVRQEQNSEICGLRADKSSLKVFEGMYCNNPALMGQISPRKKALVKPDPTLAAKSDPLEPKVEAKTEAGRLSLGQAQASQSQTTAGPLASQDVTIKLEYTAATPAPLQRGNSALLPSIAPPSGDKGSDPMAVDEGTTQPIALGRWLLTVCR